MGLARFLWIAGVVAGCSSNAPSHLPNPLLLPVYGTSSALDNASYNLRRGKVERFVAAHHAALLSEIAGAPGPYLGQAYTLARIPETERGVVTARLASDLVHYETSQEALIVALMVHGN
jgi:hypothetical protein